MKFYSINKIKELFIKRLSIYSTTQWSPRYNLSTRNNRIRIFTLQWNWRGCDFAIDCDALCGRSPLIWKNKLLLHAGTWPPRVSIISTLMRWLFSVNEWTKNLYICGACHVSLTLYKNMSLHYHVIGCELSDSRRYLFILDWPQYACVLCSRVY